MTSLLVHAVIAVMSIASADRLPRTRSVLEALAQKYATERWIAVDVLCLDDTAGDTSHGTSDRNVEREPGDAQGLNPVPRR